MGVSPYFLGAEIKTTTEHTTLTERYTTGTEQRNAMRALLAEGVSSEGSLVYSDDYDATARNAVRAIFVNAPTVVLLWC